MRLRRLINTFNLTGWWKDQEKPNSKPVITPISSQTGIYFNEMGKILFYSTQWRVNYADLKPAQIQWKQIKEHQTKIIEYCAMVNNETWYHLTDRHNFASYIRSKLKYVYQLRDIVADYLSPQSVRTKRNFGFWRRCVKISFRDINAI